MGYRAIYDLMCALLQEDDPAREIRRRAARAPLSVWRRALALEGCAPQLDRALRREKLIRLLPREVREALAESTASALRHAMRMPRQLEEIADVAHAEGLRVMALKGAARLLSGESAGVRSVSDIDLLASPADARRLYALLQMQLDYHPYHAAPEHHLPLLYRAGSLPVEVHVRLTTEPSPLDELIWKDTRVVQVGKGTLELPSPTALALHTLEHGAFTHWDCRYRLRDLLDLAAVWTRDVDAEAVRVYVRASPQRRALETLVSAAQRFNRVMPMLRPRSWRTVRRVALARHAVAAYVRSPAMARRLYWIAGVLAEGSPRALLRPARLALFGVRQASAAAVAALMLGAAGGCGDPSGTAPPDVPPFAFVSDADGNLELYRQRGDTITRLTSTAAGEASPHSAAGRIVFVSDRDGNAELYLGDLGLTSVRRLTSVAAADMEPALSPDGRLVAFARVRVNTPRLRILDTAGTTDDTLWTGDATGLAIERAPAWNPAGDRIAFTSTRTNTSQVFVVPATGGVAVQVTHEATGAFDPAWTPDGTSIVYHTGGAAPQLRLVPGTGGDGVPFAAHGTGLGQAACARESTGGVICLAATAPSGTAGDVVAIVPRGSSPYPVVTRSANDRDPVFLVP